MTKLWGGRFSKDEMDPEVLKFTSSLSVDKILAQYDCLATKVHVQMLEKCKYITNDEKDALVNALDQLLEKIENGTFNAEGHEDIHSAVQAFVTGKAPEASKKMHTGRSRNEQVVNDVRLYTKDSIAFLVQLIENLQKEFVNLAENNLEVIIPGYTHLNRAQPILFSHLVLSYVEGLERDKGRLLDALKRVSVCVMGSGALAGSALDLDRKFVADKLKFEKLSANSIDAVSDRDFIVEFVSALSLIAVHLSRISEDFILYSTSEFAFLDMGEDYCTGSSLMPQKKNPDVLELVRGKTAHVIGSVNSLLVLLKGLPHSYNRDLQEDKKHLFESVELIVSELKIMAGLVKTIELNKVNAAKALEGDFIYATDIAEYLVRKDVPFKDAHDIVGNIIKMCMEKNMMISDIPFSELRAFSESLEEDIYEYLNPEKSIKMKKTSGSTNPEFVAKEIAKWQKALKR